MGQSYNSGSTSVSGTVTAVGTFTPAKNTAGFAVNATVASNNTQTIGTVPASKVWRIIGLNINVVSDNANANTTAKLTLGGTDFLTTAIRTQATNTAQNNSSMMFDYSACPVLTAGQTVTITSSSAYNSAYGSVAYIEEAA